MALKPEAVDTFRPYFSGKTIPRPDLFQKLDRAVKRGRQLICLTAPAGYGKTVLISSWLQFFDGIPIWISCDSSNADFPRFISRLITSIQTCIPDFCSEYSTLLPNLKPAEFDAVQNLIINSFSKISETFLLCFDDYHLIEERQIHQFLTLLIDRLAEKSTIILISRTQPPLPIARFRVHIQLLELTASDLHFSSEETKAFLQANHELTLPDYEIDSLIDKTEGWAAAIHLAAMVISSGKNGFNAGSFIQSISGSQEYIASFLMDEVFALQEKSIQDFLLKTSVVDRFNIHLGAALAAISLDQADSVIEYITRANLFLVPLDSEQHWFRYHHLFSSFLRSRLASKRPIDADRLLSTASEWFLSEDFVEEAVECSLRQTSPDQAVHIILNYWPGMLHEGKIDLMINWCKRLPTSIFKRYPGMNIAHAWALVLQGHFSGVPSKLESFDQSIVETIRSEPDFLLSHEGKRLQIEKTLLMALFEYSRHQIDQGLQYSNTARDMAHPAFPLLEGNAWIISGHLNKKTGRVSESINDFQTGIPMVWKESNTQATIGAFVALATLMTDNGDLRGAAETCEAGIRLAVENQMDETPAAAPLYVTLASILIEMDRLDEAEKILHKGLDSGRVNHSLVFLTNSARTQIQLLLARGKPAEALEITDGVTHYLREANDPQALADFQAIQFLVRSVSESGDIQNDAPIPDFSPWFEQFHANHSSILVHALALAAAGNLAVASGLLDRCITVSTELDMTGVLVHCLIIRSCIRSAMGDSDGSNNDLLQAHELGDPCGFIRSFIDMPAYLHRLYPMKSDQPDGNLTFENDMVTHLTTREFEVLDLIKQGLSNQDIASRLCISLSTVKKHTSSIFRKMGVTSRSQAIVGDINKKGS